jgi:hypothetical protein
VNTADKAARPAASSSAVVDKSAYPSGICAVSVTESHAPVGFELKIKFAVADPAQPVVFDRFARRRSSDHVFTPGSANFRLTLL